MTSIGDEAYLALPKGGIVPEHVLIIPMAHVASGLTFTEEVWSDVDK